MKKQLMAELTVQLQKRQDGKWNAALRLYLSTTADCGANATAAALTADAALNAANALLFLELPVL